MKYFLIVSLLTCAFFSAHGQRLMDREGHVTFYSKAPLEDITAENRQAMAVLDASNGQVAVSMLMRGFEFEKSLMQEHFNENYIESDKYPKATFAGTIKDYDPADLKKNDKVSKAVIGEITVHGVTRPLNALIFLENKEGVLHVQTRFKVRVADHQIKIPSLVVKNIAEVVEVTADFTLELQQP